MRINDRIKSDNFWFLLLKYNKMWKCENISYSVVSDSMIPWTMAHQSPLSMEFSSKKAGVGNHSLLKGIFPTQESNLGFLLYKQIIYHLSHQRHSVWGSVLESVRSPLRPPSCLLPRPSTPRWELAERPTPSRPLVCPTAHAAPRLGLPTILPSKLPSPTLRVPASLPVTRSKPPSTVGSASCHAGRKEPCALEASFTL